MVKHLSEKIITSKQKILIFCLKFHKLNLAQIKVPKKQEVKDVLLKSVALKSPYTLMVTINKT